MSKLLRVALTPGCPLGVGPEVIAGALARMPAHADVVFQFYGSPWLLQGAASAQRVSTELRGTDVIVGAHRVICVGEHHHRERPSMGEALLWQRDALVRACEDAVAGNIDAIVTGPVRKRALVIDNVAYPGQTEIVHRYLGESSEPLMVFAGGPFVLGLHTVHMALRDVPSHVTADALTRSATALIAATRAIAGVTTPKIAVLGLNPHAGEGGMFGDEEERVVKPWFTKMAQRSDVSLVGPLPADGFFADVARAKNRGRSVGVDGVLAMYHDQALAPYKLLVDGGGINCTWGLRVPRTSPDHGTADALVGTGQADSSSMMAAIDLAMVLARGHHTSTAATT
jgi:4-hydroxythreonine-4-phosphate dehydrogenase